ncbi:hypothetical protein AAHA92_09914 [Salvia divinorum]|uniref:Uncharacterized protein n=1 Tax=Salvia divinorum TaxID=28513 RepID=A0ABD1HUL5_SALDI
MPCCRCGAAAVHHPHRVVIARSRRCLAMVGRRLRSSDSLRVITADAIAAYGIPERYPSCRRSFCYPALTSALYHRLHPHSGALLLLM